MPLAVCTWNLFHGRSQPATRRGLLPEFAAALAAHPWEVCGLQEAPPWWSRELGVALGASVRSTRTSLLRAAFPRLQEALGRRDPELLGVRGAAANVLLVRPSAGVIVDHRSATLRRFPQRRTVHAVRLRRADGTHCWVANVHTHNRPESGAAADLRRTLERCADWADGEPLVVLGDLNLPTPQGLTQVQGMNWLYGQRVDHILGRGVVPTIPPASYAHRAQLPGDVTLSDHRLVGTSVALSAGVGIANGEQPETSV